VAPAKLKQLESKIDKLIDVLQLAVTRGVIGGAAADGPMNTREAAAYLGLASGTLAIYRCSGTGPKFFLAGTSPRYRRSDLDEWLATDKPKRRVSLDVGRPPGRGKARRKAVQP
jgi:helix-turn-helix protein